MDSLQSANAGRRTRTRALQFCVIAAALAAAVFPPPAPWVERVYAGRIYPALQGRLTPWSNLTSLPLFDLIVAALVLLVIALWVMAWREGRMRRSFRPALAAAGRTLTVLALVYLWFLAAWGLNYRRPALESTIPFDRSRITTSAVRALAERAVAETNRLHAPAHAAGFPAIDAVPAALLQSLQRHSRPLTPAIPKRSLQSPFFRAAGVSGMLAPFVLETYVNPDLTPPERPYVLAHEWAHLAGYAPEADASYIGTLAALGADVPSQYSAWLELVSEAALQLPPATRGVVLQLLAEGPRRDQEEIRKRLRALVQPVQRASWATYDRMLKSQGVEEGVRSYSRVIELLIGSGVIDTAAPPPPPGVAPHAEGRP